MGCKPSLILNLPSSKHKHHSPPESSSVTEQKSRHNRIIPKIKISRPIPILEKEIPSPSTTSSQFPVTTTPPSFTNTSTTSPTSKTYVTCESPFNTPFNTPLITLISVNNNLPKYNNPSPNPPTRPRRPSSPSPPPQSLLSSLTTLEPAPEITSLDLTTEIYLVTTSIDSFNQQAELYKTTLLRHKTQTLTEFSTLLVEIPPSTTPRIRLDGIFIYLKSKYESLQRKIVEFNELVIEMVICPWQDFQKFEREEQSEMAKHLHRGCELMSMFDGLTRLRKSLEELFEDESSIRREFDVVFEEILCLLKLGGWERETMRWRVLGMCMQQRGRESASVGEEIGRRREGVSKGLLAVIEGFCEG